MDVVLTVLLWLVFIAAVGFMLWSLALRDKYGWPVMLVSFAVALLALSGFIYK